VQRSGKSSRLSTRATADRHELRLFQNLFLPSVKLVRKERVGARLRRLYDAPRTALERVQAAPDTDVAAVAQLVALRDQLDPFALAQAIDRKLDRLLTLATGPHSTPGHLGDRGRPVLTDDAGDASARSLPEHPGLHLQQPPRLAAGSVSEGYLLVRWRDDSPVGNFLRWLDGGVVGRRNGRVNGRVDRLPWCLRQTTGQRRRHELGGDRLTGWPRR